MNIPNALSVSRIVAIPILMAVMLLSFPGHDQLAAALFIVFSLTDTLDGQIARRTGAVTDFGKFADTLADKIFVLSVLLVLVQEGLVAAWVVAVIFSRELIIMVLRWVAASQGRIIPAAPLGKTKTVMQMTAVTLLILQRPYPEMVGPADATLLVALVFTVWSGFDYLWRFRYLIGPFDTSRARIASGGAPEPDLSRDLGEALIAAGVTLSVAESCTGGLLGSLITDRPGSSRYFKGGVIAYSDEVKRQELGVPAGVLDSAGAVSREAAEAMAEGARTRLGTGIAVSVTGIAGPGADGSRKPVGLTYVAVASARGVSSREFRFSGDRTANRRAAATEAMRMVIEEAKAVASSPVKTA